MVKGVTPAFLVGCMICAYSVDIKKQMSEIADQFQKSVKDIDGSVQDIIKKIGHLSHMLTEISGMANGAESDVHNAVEIVNANEMGELPKDSAGSANAI